MPQLQLPIFPAGITEINNQIAVEKSLGLPRSTETYTPSAACIALLKGDLRETDQSPRRFGGPPRLDHVGLQLWPKPSVDRVSCSAREAARAGVV